MSEGSMELLVGMEEVRVRFGGREALRGVSLEVHAGELVAVVGSDGAGKTTLLRAMAGLLRPGSGRVVLRVGKEDLGYSGAEFDLYGDLTVEENLAFLAAVRGMERRSMVAARDRLLALVGLTEARGRLAAKLSGGMKKKLGLAGALMHEPRLLLLDEPTVGVDPASRRELWDVVAQAHAWGTAVVFTTTYLDEAERAGRMLDLQAGVLRGDYRAAEEVREQGWSAWRVCLPAARGPVRARLHQLGLGGTVYLTSEGMTLLVLDRTEAEETARRILGPEETAVGRGLEPIPLTLEDVFVIS